MRSRSRGGVTLVEILICLAILTSALVPLATALLGASRGSKDLEGRLKAQALLASTLEALAALPFEDLEGLADPATRRGAARRLPEPGDGLQVALAVGPAAGADPAVLREVRVTVCWGVAGVTPSPASGAGPRRQCLSRTQLISNRKASLTHDGKIL